MKIINNGKILFFIGAIIFMISCEGEQGSMGISGINGLTELLDEPSGINCENGGIKMNLGLDNNTNGLLDANEVITTNFICNGLNGKISLTDVIEEPIGENCANGGYKINSGLDTNDNGSLEENEISSSVYLCNGLDGNSTLTRTTNEPTGDNCPNGGIKIDTGIDENGDGVLDESEINSSAFVCNGQDGNKSLVNVVDLPVSTECPNGGTVIQTGIDNNNNDILEVSEIQSSRNICNGIDGEFNEEIRLVLVFTSPGSSSGTSSSEGKIFGKLIKFDKRRWSLLNSVTFRSQIWTSNSSTTCFVELYNETDGEVIPMSTLSTNSSSFLGEIVTTSNIYNNLPDKEITLSLRLRTQNEGENVFITRKSELIINRGN